MFGVMLVLYGEADALPAATVVTISRTVSLAVLTPVVLGFLVVGRPIRPASGTGRLVAAVGVLDALALIVATIALGLGPLSVASVVVTQFATVAAVLGIFVLHERPARHQLVGVVTVIVGVSLLAAAV